MSLTRATILAFHQISRHRFPGINNIPPRDFEAIISLLPAQGFTFWHRDVPTDQITSRTVVVTFDDGYADIAESLQLLLKRDATPVVFVPTAYVGRSNDWDYSSRLAPVRHLNVGEIRELADSGVLFGSHGHTHRALTTLTDRAITDELDRSGEILTGLTGVPVTWLSYPFGRCDQRIKRLARQSGYRYGFSLGNARNADSLSLQRIGMYACDDYFSLIEKLSGRDRIGQTKSKIISLLAAGSICREKLLKRRIGSAENS
jgi:peptidoglycan/xylan/chitin deacetylase (PgdA/CDA1 family)